MQKTKSPYKLNQLFLTLLNSLIQSFFVDYFLCNLPQQLSFTNTLVAPFLMFFFQDLYFYCLHRLMHHKNVYKYCHKTHHTYKQPNIWASYYEHPIEHIIVWTMPYILFPLMMDISVYAYWAFVCFTTLVSLEGHSGNNYKGMYWYVGYFETKAGLKHIWFYNHALHHDLHHVQTNSNFGLWTTLPDRLFKSLYIDYDEWAKNKISE